MRFQVYVHHYVSSSKFILGNGAELRGSFTRRPLPEPYSLVVDTEDLKEDLIRYALLTGCPFNPSKAPCGPTMMVMVC